MPTIININYIIFIIHLLVYDFFLELLIVTLISLKIIPIINNGRIIIIIIIIIIQWLFYVVSKIY